jgi:hypothetical protein
LNRNGIQNFIIIFMNDVIGLMAANELFSLVAHKEASGNIIGMVADELCVCSLPSVPIQNNLERNGFQIGEMAFSAHQLSEPPAGIGLWNQA